MSVDNTLKQRGNRYGTFENNARLTQALMDVVDELGQNDLSPVHREMVHMTFHKIARMCCGDQWYEDNPHDIAGYAKLLEDHIKEVMYDEEQFS